MKLAFPRDRLIPALEKVAKVAPTSRTVPILTYTRIATQGPALCLLATDLVTSIAVTVTGIPVKEPGTALLPVHDFLTYLKALDQPYVTLATTDKGIRSQSGTNACLWKAPPLDQFPTVADLEDQYTHTLRRIDLIRALRLVKPAAASSAFHPNLEQIGIRHGKILAADGIRYHEVALADTAQMDIALPLAFLDNLLTLIGSVSADTIDIGIPEDRQSIAVRLDSTTLSTARKRETFPDVAHAFLVPAMTNTTTLRVGRTALAAAVRRVRLMSDPATRAVRILLSGTDFSTATVSAQQPTGAWATEEIGVEWAGGDRTLVFNHEYLTNLLSLFEAEQLTLRLGEDTKNKPSPVLIQEGDRSGVLMQLRLDWT
jgi:DNA polymerase III subunit beta